MGGWQSLAFVYKIHRILAILEPVLGLAAPRPRPVTGGSDGFSIAPDVGVVFAFLLQSDTEREMDPVPNCLERIV